jgi:PAS domain S-box-containing protein
MKRFLSGSGMDVRKGLRSLPLALSILFCIIAIGTLALDVRSRLDALQAANSDNLQWNVMQSEVEALRLQQALSDATMAVGTDTQPEALDEVRRWFNVYYSRIAMLQSSDAHGVQLAKDEYKPDMETIRRILDSTVPLIDGKDIGLLAALPDIKRDAAILRQASRSITLKSLAEFSARSDRERGEISSTLFRLAGVTSLLMLMLVAVAVGTARLYRTAESRAEALRLTGGRLSTIVDNSADAIVVTDRMGVIHEFNPAAQRIFGMTRDQAIGGGALDLLFAAPRGNGQRRKLISAMEDTVLAGRGPLRVEVDARRGDGTSFPVEVSIAMTHPADQVLVVSFVRDISDRRRAQAELESALDRAVAGEKAKAHFIAVMSHEMRTPLNGLLGSMALLNETSLTAEQRDLLAVMEKSGDILLGHVNSVLDISRAEAGAIKVIEQPFDLEDLVGEVIANQTGLAAKVGTRITLNSVNGPVGLVAGDQARVRQVLLNLVGNAVKFTHDGLITVETEALPPLDALQGKRAVEIRVIDTGTGIPEDKIDTIFEDFVTLDTRYERTTSGTGLGLGIARRLVEAMGGEIGVESEHGEGSLFWLRLPLPAFTRSEGRRLRSLPVTNTSDAMAEGDLPPPPSAVEPPASPPCNVLAVEDNEINRFLLRRHLEGAGHAVTEAADGEEGVRLAAATRYDVIFMDISMPRLDGVEATRRIRAAGESRKSWIVALTAHALPEELERFRQAGMDMTLTKPIGRQELLTALARLNAGEPATPTSAPPIQLAQVTEGRVVDRRALADLRKQIGAMAAAGLVRRLVEDGDNTLALIHAAPLKGREAEVAASCHQLAGTGGAFGTVQLREALVTVEHRLNRHDLDGIEADVDRLDRLWAVSRDILLADAEVMLAETA